MKMSSSEFVRKYMDLVNAYTEMSQAQREEITAEFVKYRAVQENWVTRFVGVGRD